MVVLLHSARAQLVPADYSQHFTYDKAASFGEKIEGTGGVPGVTTQDFTYIGADGAPVPSTLISPKDQEVHPAILWGHWLMPGSPLANRQEFEDEAIMLAHQGVISLLIDSPQARPGFKPTPNPALIKEQVVDLERAIDWLSALKSVDPKRIAYVGQSWNSGTGAILDSIDKRPAAFVFMSGPQSNLDYVLHSDSPRMLEARKKADMTKVEQQMKANAWADPGSYAPLLGPSPALFQYGSKDEDWVPLAEAKSFAASASGPKEVKFYDSNHALNAQARQDRIAFLAKHLNFTPPAAERIAAIPQLK